MTTQDNAILVKLSQSVWTGRKTDKLLSQEMEITKGAERGSLNTTKMLINKEHLKPIRAIASECRVQHYALTRVWDDTSRRLLPNVLVKKHAEMITEYEGSFNIERDVFIMNYPQMVEDARLSLGNLYDPADYPDNAALMDMFKISVDAEPIPSGSSLPLTMEDRDQLVLDIETRTREKMKESSQALFHRVKTEIKSMHERLSDYDNKVSGGESTRLHESLLGNLREMAEVLPKLNIENDPFLDGISARLLDSLKFLKADDLKKDPSLRLAVINEVREIETSM